MNRIILLILVLGFAKANAQMGEAQQVHWDWDSVGTYKTNAGAVWDLLKETQKWNEISNGFVKSVTVKGEHPNQVRELSFTDGRVRKDEVAQFQPEHKMVVIQLVKPLQPGIEEAMMAFFLTGEGGEAKLRITIMVKGEVKARKQLVEELSKEGAAYLKGIGNQLELK
ncbi:MAG: hypothetical protein ACTHMC_21830 [Pseudobacter sp.]|uniref:hypothetical protein n=1 Tax=Pseudobacter sp. TaxID=2045420 RepID=UPI003F7EE6D8